MSKEKIIAIQELTQHYGWELVSDHIKTQRAKHVYCLCKADKWEDVLRHQERVKMCDYILGLPREMIKGETKLVRSET